jgi:protein SCO1/2
MRRFDWVGALLLATWLLGALPAQAGRWGKDYVPNVAVVTQDGKTLQFYDDPIKDKIVVLSFIYTSCKDICPLATARLGEARAKLGSRVGRDIFFYSISIDPEHDSPQRLKLYADAFQAGPGWLFLTGLPEDIQAIRHKFGDRRPDLGDHRNDVVLGNGATGEWQRESALGDLEHFVGAIQAMDLQWRAESQLPADSDAATARSRQPLAISCTTTQALSWRAAKPARRCLQKYAPAATAMAGATASARTSMV